MQTAKDKITTAVTEYKKLFPDEYKAFLKSNQLTINKQNDQWASTGSKDNLVERHMYDVPEKLYGAIQHLLNNEERDWFASRGAYLKNFKASKWFMETFPEFKVTKEF